MSNSGYTASCACGEVAFEVDKIGVQNGTRLICYCRSCRAADVYLRGDNSGLTKDMGVEILHSTPDHLQISKGQDKLAAIKLNEKGAMRWYASCCGTPLWNSLSTTKIPFLGILISP